MAIVALCHSRQRQFLHGPPMSIVDLVSLMCLTFGLVVFLIAKWVLVRIESERRHGDC
jgi:hypothetical protein